MSWQHPGQGIPEMTREEHDGALNAKRVSMVSGATIYAIVNTGAAGNATVLMPGGVTVFQGSQPWNSLGTVTLTPSPSYIGLVSVLGKVELAGNATLSDSKTYIGLTTTTLGVGSSFIGLASIQGNVNVNGNVTLSDSKTYIGLTTATLGASPAFVGIVTVANPNGSILGNVTLSDAKTYIGLTTTTLGVGTTYIGLASVNVGGSLPAGANYIGLSTVTLGVGDRFIGLATVVHAGNVTLNASAAYIGLVSISHAAWANPNTFIGLVTAVPGANVTLNQSAAFIGLATVVIGNASVATKNAGTTKTLKILPVLLSTNSNTSIAITNTSYITHILLNSNATVRLNVKSGATYLTGNASLGINIFPGGGWVENGSPDSPLYIGQAAAAAINFEKFDAGGTISQVAGHVTYFDE